jgi:hypothetical protein
MAFERDPVDRRLDRRVQELDHDDEQHRQHQRSRSSTGTGNSAATG